jgi:hypothetical protein
MPGSPDRGTSPVDSGLTTGEAMGRLAGYDCYRPGGPRWGIASVYALTRDISCVLEEEYRARCPLLECDGSDPLSSRYPGRTCGRLLL